MGLFFTLFYVFAAYIGPQTLFGNLAEDHIQVVIVFLALVCSIPALARSGLPALAQTYGLLGLCVAVPLSLAFNGWMGGAPIVLLDFIPNAIVFFLLLANCVTKRRTQIVIAVLFLAALFIIIQGWLAERAGNLLSPYVLSMNNSDDVAFLRARGLNFLSDPNDLAQFLAGLIPCLFFFWAKKSTFRNLLLVYAPASVLLFGMYLTHSRGGMIALLAAAIVTGRRKIGAIPAVVVSIFLFLGLSAIGWSGGRDVSADSGADRVEAWSAGLDLIRAHPVFGVGYLRFTDFFYITAHNTVVVCAAELGIIGFFFWMLLVLPSLRNVVAGAKPAPSGPEGEPTREISMSRASETAPPHVPAFLRKPEMSLPTAAKPDDARPPWLIEQKQTSLPAEERRRLCSLMVVSLTGFLTAAWFLSRPYTMALFVEVGLAATVYRLAQQDAETSPPIRFGKILGLSAIACISLLLVVYTIVRFEHLAGL